MTRGLFITGTDTGAGKTMVTAALAAALRRRGWRVGVMKPVETGCLREDGRLVPEDAVLLRRASSCTAPLDVINPYALREPLAPALAAEREGVVIAMAHLRACHERLAAEHDLMLVEGAGGLLVPLTATSTMLDLASELNLPLLIVARNVLGVINHAALTVRVAQQGGVPVAGVVLNHTAPGGDLAMETNAAAIRRWVPAPLLAELPYREERNDEALAALGERLDIESILAACQEAMYIS